MNKVILTGRLVRDPEDKMTVGGTSVCEFVIAVDRPFRKGAEKETDFIGCIAWRATAEFVVKHFHKGSPILVEGRMQNDKWTDKEGKIRDKWRVTVDNVDFFGGAAVGESATEPEPDEDFDESLPF